MFKIRGHEVSEDGHTISYNYSATGAAAAYFDSNCLFEAHYDVDVRTVPASIALIPLLANVAPIAWFAGFDVSIPEIDSDYHAALIEIRFELTRHHPRLGLSRSELEVGRLVDNRIEGTRPAVFFSGGVDAFATLYRHFDEQPVLLTIHGADIDLSDQRQWNDVVEFNETTAVLSPLERHYLAANLRTFYTYRVDLLLEGLGWWGMVQHGLAMLSLAAPLSYSIGLGRLYIASSNSDYMEDRPWGSVPGIDEKVSWARVEVVHDGWELRRQDKVELIVESTVKRRTETPLRVCYSEFKDGLNCSTCEKCLRTIFGIILAGGDPRGFHLNADENVYSRLDAIVDKGFSGPGARDYWLELRDKALMSPSQFIFADKEREIASKIRLAASIRASVDRGLAKPTILKRFKHVIIAQFPRLFAAYLKVRRAFA